MSASRSVWTEMPFMQGPKGADRLRELVPVLGRVHNQAQERRSRVLAHDWARKRLCAILHLQRAEQWNGYVPPGTDHMGALNDSPGRHALIQLLHEVDQCDRGQG